MAQRSGLILFPLLFFSCQILSSSSSSYSPSTEAQRLIRSFNLFPSSGVNSGGPSSVQLPDAVLSSSLVEKQFRLPIYVASIRKLNHYVGYYRLPHSRDARHRTMFYLFFESRRNKLTDPVVIWLSGGPGISFLISMFYENEPYHITNNNTLILNDYGWDQISNLIYVDQPIGTGFSYSSDNSDFRNDQEGVSNDLYDFLQGLAIGNGLTDLVIQYKSMPEYAKSVNLITESQAMEVSKLIPACERDAAKCNAMGGGGDSCIEAHSSCKAIFDHIKGLIGDRNIYDIRKRCESHGCYDFSYMLNILNERSVREALGVRNISFVSPNRSVYNAFLKDFSRNHAAKIPPLLDYGIKVLIYAGEYDLLCNWLGNLWWVMKIEWWGQRQFNDAPITSYIVNGNVEGKLKRYGPLSFLKVFNSGHMVSMDQPKVALEMLDRWTKGPL
ncbi:serine carboxypeptidase-like 48 [Impatiens glandulifera]|uniref:serine carboxypeptidase-like 48 n=1 Tax=Impatiens glandulifera TaxID=253017 RepID=UPI001FB0E4D0|nr:serine carboxypeptidase-like 48 [Impatiens glandulifera]